MNINYDNRWFAPHTTSANGEANAATVFHYRQRGHTVWATYTGGGIEFGTLTAIADDEGRLNMRYSHVNTNGELMTGRCLSTPEVLPDGRLRLYEKWQWTCGDESAGESIVEEVVGLSGADSG